MSGRWGRSTILLLWLENRGVERLKGTPTAQQEPVAGEWDRALSVHPHPGSKLISGYSRLLSYKVSLHSYFFQTTDTKVAHCLLCCVLSCNWIDVSPRLCDPSSSPNTQEESRAGAEVKTVRGGGGGRGSPAPARAEATKHGPRCRCGRGARTVEQIISSC